MRLTIRCTAASYTADSFNTGTALSASVCKSPCSPLFRLVSVIRKRVFLFNLDNMPARMIFVLLFFPLVFSCSDASAEKVRGNAATPCASCHKTELRGSHAAVACASCHTTGGKIYGRPADSQVSAFGCTVCHKGSERIFSGVMAMRSSEKEFVKRSYAKLDSGFYDKNCSSCHLSSCSDCHGSGHEIRIPRTNDCQKCHKGYYTGWDYSGRAPREANMRYQRGVEVNGETFLKMLPDVHFQKGMACGACHSMKSLAAGRKSSRRCLDCHRPDMRITEHSIPEHMRNMECYACHSAWGAQEYGTFFLRFRDAGKKENFDLKAESSPEYLRSAYLKKQDATPLGINREGKISPIRPMFIAYYTDTMLSGKSGQENLLLAAEWRAYFPHTIQRGSTACEGCHDNPGRFLLEPEAARIYQLEKDGMGLPSFWSQSGQKVVNGSFVPISRHIRMNRKGARYSRAHTEKWKKIIGPVERLSSD